MGSRNYSMDSPKTSVELPETEKDFGIIPLNEKREYIFKLVNRGDKPLVVYDVATSCGCTKAEYDKKLKEVKSEADGMLEDARKRAKKQESDIISEAKEEAGRILKRAEKEAALEKNKVQDEMKQEMIAIAQAMAGKMISVSMDEKAQNELLETTLKEMGEETWQN